MTNLPPGMLLILGACVVPFLPKPARKFGLVLLPLLSFAHLLSFGGDYTAQLSLLGHQLTPVRIDRLSLIWGTIFHLATALGCIYALGESSWLRHASGLVYAGSSIAAVFAGDLLTLFVFWEMTAVASVFLIWAQDTPRAARAGMRYLLIQVLSGVLLLAGAALAVHENGSLAFAAVDQLSVFRFESTSTWLLLFAFAIKAAFPLLHTWLVDAYPESTPAGAVFLSAFTTKLAIYALARTFAGTQELVWIGAAMTVFPIFFALLEDDLRRVLAYGLINQLGYMVVGIGIGSELAINGAAAHAVAHILYKGLLFMSIGAVMAETGTARASKLGNLSGLMPWTARFCLIGAASIAAVPLFSGFVTKSMILSAVGKEHLFPVWLTILFGTVGVVISVDIKVPYCAFFRRNPDAAHPIRQKQPVEAPKHMLVAMGIAAACCMLIGVFPGWLYRFLPYRVDYSPYSVAHVVTQLQLLSAAALVFFAAVRLRILPLPQAVTVLDVDWLVRIPLQQLFEMTRRTTAAIRAGLGRHIDNTSRSLVEGLAQLHAPGGKLAQTWSTAAMALAATLLLLGYLLLYYGRAPA